MNKTENKSNPGNKGRIHIMVKLPRKLKKAYRQFRRNPFKQFTVKQKHMLRRFFDRENLRDITDSIQNLLNTPLEQRVFKPSNTPLSKIHMLEEYSIDEFKVRLKSPFEKEIEAWADMNLNKLSLKGSMGEDYEPSI